MKTLSQAESARVAGGGDPVTLGAALIVGLFSAGAYIGKDIYDNWGEFKAAVADGWNNV